MSRTVGISLSTEDLISLCAKYHCTTDALGRVLKASILDMKHSPYYRSLEGEISAERLIDKIKRSEQFSTTDETKEIIGTIVREYAGIVKEIIQEDESVKRFINQ